MNNEKKQVSGWKIWGTNFDNAKRFFESRGNVKTRSKLKDKWFNDFKKDLEMVDKCAYFKGLKSIIKKYQ